MRPPYGLGVEIGRTYDYEMYVHCGVEWALIDGAWWQSDYLSDGNANPPDGWGNPVDAGRLTLTSPDTASYAGGPDTSITFRRTDVLVNPVQCE